ncbi:MAG: hypothetical protein JWO99_843 [Candidatus Saccharibacteria bacterium]|nr:hypothetical protein [Candidatus Saccharibacteria bacterium]
MAYSKNGEYSGADLVGVVSTFYTNPEDIRFQLALENAERWQAANLPLVIVDGSPVQETGNWVEKALTERGADVIRAEVNGIASQRQQGINYAVSNGAEKMVGHEPEKIEMSRFSDAISDALSEHAVLVIGRTAAAKLSLPSVQRRTEQLAGWTLEQTHHLPPDALSGGRGFTVAGAEVLSRYPATDPAFNNWIYLYTTPLEARKAGLSIGGLGVDLIHSPIMTEEEQGNPIFDRKRYDQFKLQLDYMLARADVDPAAQPIACAVLEAMTGLTKESSNAEFEAQLDLLEARLSVFGYGH